MPETAAADAGPLVFAPMVAGAFGRAVGTPLAAEIHETHSAVIVLLGDYAYKIKKPVNLGFLDFRSGSARRRAVERELRLNRRLAPDVYLDTAELRSSNGGIVESALVMRRMPDERRLSRLVSDPDTRPDRIRDELRRLAHLLASFHARAERSAQISAEAGSAGLRRRWSDNLRELRGYVGPVLDPAAYDEIGELALTYVDGRGPMFARRAAAGLYVDGHGDVTADDVFCLDDGPRVLDCLDFDDRLRWVDVLDDVAFLAMDLEHRGHPRYARYFLDRYREFSAVSTCTSLEHHYLAYRAVVRAKVSCIRAAQGGVAAQQDATAFFDEARRHLRQGAVRLVLVGGPPGVGKTSVAGALADALDAVLLSTDRVRLDQNGGSPTYDDASRERVYACLLARAKAALENGETVVADATWGRAAQRELAATCARDTGSQLVSFECHAPRALAVARAERRRRAGTDASEAGAAVAARLAEERDPWPGAVPVDSSGSVQEAVAAIADVLPLPRPPARQPIWGALHQLLH